VKLYPQLIAAARRGRFINQVWMVPSAIAVIASTRRGDLGIAMGWADHFNCTTRVFVSVFVAVYVLFGQTHAPKVLSSFDQRRLGSQGQRLGSKTAGSPRRVTLCDSAVSGL
jgi:hypothetical protein